jgi:GAF domain-containing protein
MNTIYKKLSIVAIILFLIGIVGVTYFFYRTSTDIATALHIQEISRIEIVEQALKPFSVAVGVEFFLGISAILLLLLGKQTPATEIKQSNEGHTDFSTHTTLTEGITNTTYINKRVAIIQNKLQASYPDNRTKLEKVLSSICDEMEACQGAIFQTKQTDQKRFVEMCASFAYFVAESKTISYEFGEGLTGQVAKEGKAINISTVPDGYVTIISGLGNSSPKHLIISPVKSEIGVVGVIEVASFKPFTKTDEEFLNELSPLLLDLMAIHNQEEVIA